MQPTYILGIDAAKHKIRATLRGAREERFRFEMDLPVSAAGRRELLLRLKAHVPAPAQLLVLIEATGLLHLPWSAALAKAGYAVAVINPLMARRLHTVENSLRDSKSDPIDARGLCGLGVLHGAKLVAHYRFGLKPDQFALQRLQTVRKAMRNALTNLKKTYQSVLELSFPELGSLLEVDGVGIRELLASAPTPAAIARKRLSTLENNWMLRPKAARLKALATDSIADPDLSAASAPALQAILETVATMEARLRHLDQQIETLAAETIDPKTKALVESIPGFGPTTAAKVLAYLPTEVLHSGSNRKVAARLQAFMGNDPRLQESGQWKGQTRMSKRGVEPLRTAFFQAAFNAAQHDPELKTFYQRKRSQNKCHHVALSHLMRILTRRLVAVLRSGHPYQPNLNLALQNAA
jgi:transposase